MKMAQKLMGSSKWPLWSKLREKLFDIFFLIAFSRESEIIYLMVNTSNFCKAEGASCFQGCRDFCISFSSKAYLPELDSQAMGKHDSQEPNLSVFCRKLFSDFIVVRIMVWYKPTQLFFFQITCIISIAFATVK